MVTPKGLDWPQLPWGQQRLYAEMTRQPQIMHHKVHLAASPNGMCYDKALHMCEWMQPFSGNEAYTD
jgi:hypothetical protein